MALGFVLYFLVRGAVIDQPDVAYRHAIDVIELERDLGWYWEDDLNRWATQHRFWAQTLNLIYFWLHFPLIIGFGLWLYFVRRREYTLLRDALLTSGGVALFVYWAYPLAPPRELPALAATYGVHAPADVTGFVDTMREYLGYGYQAQSMRPFVNPYAAMPSLHFGWDVLLGAAFIRTARGGRWMWVAVPVGIGLPALQVLAITATANHFFLDAIAGALVAAVGAGIALALRRWAYPRLAAAGLLRRWRQRRQGLV